MTKQSKSNKSSKNTRHKYNKQNTTNRNTKSANERNSVRRTHPVIKKKNTKKNRKRHTRHRSSLTGLAMKPPPFVPDEVFQPINEHINSFPLLLKYINNQFRIINDMIKQTKKKWVEMIPNTNGRLEIVENTTIPTRTITKGN